MSLKCEYCRNNAVQIWTGTDLFYKTGMNRVRPVLIPLCERHSLKENVTELVRTEVSENSKAKELSFELISGWEEGSILSVEAEKGRKMIEAYLTGQPEIIKKLTEALLHRKEASE